MAVASLWGEHWTPSSDLALLDLRIRDIGGPNTPLLGPFSRFGWSHPGPMLFWCLSPVVWLLGGGPVAGLAAAGVQNVVVVVGIGLTARRVGGRRFALLTSLALALLVASSGGQLLVSTWNPWIAVLPFVLFVLAAWGLAGGDRWMAPVVVVVGSYLVQSHVGYGPLVAALVVAAGAMALLEQRSTGRAGGEDPGSSPGAGRPSLRRVGLVSAVAGLACWSGPIVDQLTRDPGNMVAIARYFAGDSGDAPVGFERVGTIVGRQLAPWGPWAGGDEPLDFLATLTSTSIWTAAPVLLLFAAGTAFALRRRDWSSVRLQVLASVGLATGVVATSRITDLPYYYLIRWWWVLAMFTWLAALRPFVVIDLPERARRGLGVACVAGACLAALLGATGATDPVPWTIPDRAVERLGPEVVDELESRNPGSDGPYLIRSAGFSWFEVQMGLLNLLDSEGYDMKVDQRFEAHGGRARVVGQGEPVAGVIMVTTGEQALADIAARPGAAEIAVHDPLTADERAELHRLQDQLRDEVRAAGRDDLVEAVDSAGVGILPAVIGVDADAAARVQELLGAGPLVGVFLLPPDSPV